MPEVDYEIFYYVASVCDPWIADNDVHPAGISREIRIAVLLGGLRRAFMTPLLRIALMAYVLALSCSSTWSKPGTATAMRGVFDPLCPADSIPGVDTALVEVLPIVSYDTDTGFGYGLKTMFKGLLHARESIDLTAFNSSKGERWYRLVVSVPDFEIRQGKVYPLAIDLVVDYDKWIRNSFFGIGNASRFADREYYTKEPFDLSLIVGRGFTPHIVGQSGIRYRTVRNSAFDARSRLVDSAPDLNASRTKYISVFGTVRYDTRDSYINPSRGLVLQGEAEGAPRIEWNNVSFSRFALAVRNYTTLFSPGVVLALRGEVQGIAGGDLPVQLLMSIGGNGTVRGAPQDRYLDRISGVLNAELRFPLYWRFGGVAGLDGGNVWSSVRTMGFSRSALSATLGLRFYFDSFVVRADAGFGSETTGFYLNFGQLF